MTEKELRAVFSENIRKHRTGLRWSQAFLAKKAGVTTNFVNDIEAKRKWASPATMVRLANAFDIEVYELLRPSALFPDNLEDILKNYTGEILAAIEQTCAAYLEKSNALPSKPSP
jgi:transcriptional regulator with XRE-family HTH domain